MTRSILALLAVGSFVTIVAGPGCKATGVGDPCTPEQEYDPTFAGFDEKEVNVESKSFQCQTRVCLANHFRGRVSCPYGQDATGNAPMGAPPPNNSPGCVVPGTMIPVDPTVDQNGNPLMPPPKAGKTVQAQCTDRRTDNAVYCSCRCANVDGNQNDNANYCSCPDGYTCAQLVTSIGAGDTGLTGAYCIKNGTDYKSGNACAESCNPTANKCD